MKTIQLHNKTMAYRDEGEGFPLLLGHSYLFNSDMWAPQIEVLSKKYRVIAPDLWGHGNSAELPEQHKTLADLARDYLALMDQLGIKEFAVIGLSAGGMWGTELAAMVPNRVKALVLMDTFVGLEPEVTHKKYFAMLDMIEQAGAIPQSLLQQIVPIFFSQQPAQNLVDELTQRLVTIPAEVLCNSIVPLGRMIFGREDRTHLLEKLDIPALVITGEQDMPRPPLEGYLMAEILRCDYVVIQDAGHISTLEQPHKVNQELVAFLQQAL
ncbi:2-succinyl-6-hydroxy-2,4-cyclohexadiene-1-carboxylate synthase [Photorhabdus temperata]|uniref:Alpha/beta fold hydrolase n=2 Tax=Photorhabdus khanii TaxID=1004150 RepID=A0A7C9GM51_9GAMM|nr:alpha/beta hydrolase [Photorhabdus khanii]ETS29907.1 putative hydrolase or acyltransferase of alpha/beta superfamily [Photorhabdus khanii NC19]MQL50217.1 alpha/beta fold hydrolase [Photorhabdus khanii]OHV51469.1 2-succinyl-6-hydroxy-2,4-cyclohexadiene-1-carboxylate synthase [Photorhabdus temperata]